MSCVLFCILLLTECPCAVALQTMLPSNEDAHILASFLYFQRYKYIWHITANTYTDRFCAYCKIKGVKRRRTTHKHTSTLIHKIFCTISTHAQVALGGVSALYLLTQNPRCVCARAAFSGAAAKCMHAKRSLTPTRHSENVSMCAHCWARFACVYVCKYGNDPRCSSLRLLESDVVDRCVASRCVSAAAAR